MEERIEEIRELLREKWIGIIALLVGIPMMALGGWLIHTFSKGELRTIGGTVFVLGGLILFGLFWLV